MTVVAALGGGTDAASSLAPAAAQEGVEAEGKAAEPDEEEGAGG